VHQHLPRPLPAALLVGKRKPEGDGGGTGLTEMQARVTDSQDESYTYDNAQIHGRAARFKLGKGLRDNYLQVTLLSTGPAFVVDRVEFDPIVAAQRRL
jgi:hypothetical protein